MNDFKNALNIHRRGKMDALKKKPECVDTKREDVKQVSNGLDVAYICFFVLGVGLLLPWTFFINANSYFKQKLMTNPRAEDIFESSFSMSSQISCGLGIVLNIYLTNQTSRQKRIILTLLVLMICFILTTVLANVNTDTWTNLFFLVTLISIVVINFSAGIAMGTMFGTASILGRKYSHIASVGMAISGLFASITNLTSIAIGDNVIMSATIYFSIAAASTIICMIMSVVLFRLKRVSEYLGEEDAVISTSKQKQQTSMLDVLYFIYPLALAVVVNFGITISLMPTVISKVQSNNMSNNSQWSTKYFNGVVGFLFFNISDFTGRTVAGFLQIPGNKSFWLPFLSILRIVFIPLLILCNYQPRRNLPVYFNDDIYFAVINIVFGSTHGYLITVSIMEAPEIVPIELTETAGATMQLFLIIGMIIGAAASFAYLNVI